MKILILKPSSLGDVVQALPVLRLLKLHRPDSRIFWWLESSLVPLLENDPDLAGVFPFSRKRWSAPHRWPEAWASIRAMRRERFDYAIDLQGLFRSGLFAWFANAGLSIGLDNAGNGLREGARGFYDITAPAEAERTHAVERYLSVLPLLGVPAHSQFIWLPERPNVAERLRKKWQPGGACWIALLPGARWNNKRWPIEHFTALINRLLPRSPDLRFAILGGNDDRPLGRALAGVAPARCLDLTGQTSLWEMVEWIRLSRLVITNDTGPMHIAAALGRPIIALFGPTDPARTGPYGQLQNVIEMSEPPCIPCLKDYCSYSEPVACLRAITPALIAERAWKHLDS